MSIMVDQEKIASLRLIRSENIGIKTFYNLLKFYGNAQEAVSRLSSSANVGLKTKPIKLASLDKVENELEQLNKIGAELLYFKDKAYPKLLKVTGDVPPFLTMLGNKDLLEKQIIAIVGSRNASINGMNFTRKLANELGGSEFIVASGLARGIDSAAHSASIKSGTIAVIAGGIDHIYPPENAKLYKEIADTGLIIAENPYGTIPVANNFPQRNRIISGISIGTIVVEASLKSGSLITARFAAEQGRHVFAVPGFPMDYRFSGTNYLLKQGATLIESAQDVIDFVGASISQSCNLQIKEEQLEMEDESRCEIRDAVAQIQDLILSSVGFTPTYVDDLVKEHNLSVDLVQVAVLELELEGKIVKSSNNTVILVSN